MSSFINTETMEWPLHEGDLHIQFGDDVPNCIKPLFYAIQEGAGNQQTYEKNEPIEIDGNWIVSWKIVDKTEEQILEERELENKWTSRPN
jgi:hypothetical protein